MQARVSFPHSPKCSWIYQWHSFRFSLCNANGIACVESPSENGRDSVLWRLLRAWWWNCRLMLLEKDRNSVSLFRSWFALHRLVQCLLIVTIQHWWSRSLLSCRSVILHACGPDSLGFIHNIAVRFLSSCMYSFLHFFITSHFECPHT
jgi:hypothetical protein